jgi:hypothetical protein
MHTRPATYRPNENEIKRTVDMMIRNQTQGQGVDGESL